MASVDGEQVENNLERVATWHVLNAHARDVARDKYIRRKATKSQLAKPEALAPPLRWLAVEAAGAASELLRTPGLPDKLDKVRWLL